MAIDHSVSDIEHLDVREDCLFFKVNETDHIAGVADLEASIEIIPDDS
jgi:hypothetical protein